MQGACIKKRRHLIFMNIKSLCFTVEETFGPWDLRRIVIVSLQHKHPL